MRTEELVDDGLSLGDNISPTDASYLQRRRRALVLARDIFAEVYTARPWPRRRTSANLTVTAGAGKVNAPWDYGRIGPYGGLYIVQGGVVLAEDPLELVPEHEIVALRAGDAKTDTPDRFAIYDVTSVGRDAYRDIIQLPMNTGVVYLQLHYLRKTPWLLDAGDPEVSETQAVILERTGTTVTATTVSPHGFSSDQYVVIADATAADYEGTFQIVVTGPSTFTYEITTSPASPDAGTAVWDVARYDGNLAYVPDEFHEPVLAKGLRAKLRESKGDARWAVLQAEYMQALKSLKAERNRWESSTRSLPSFFGGR